MKSILKAVLLLTLSLMLVLSCMTGCSSKGKNMMELEKNEITVNMFMLLMSRMKGNLASSYAFGTQALKDSFWDTVMDASTGETYDEYYTDLVLENAKTYLAALHKFDELDLELPKETIDEIDEQMKMLVESDGNGSKAALNAVLAEYGANYKILREAYIMEAKIAYLNDYLFGADGSLISEENYESYYQKNYVRFRQIFFFTTKPVYETDANGDVIYYSDLSAKKIAYDSNREGAKKMTDAQGAVVKDSNGSIIWVYEKDGVEHVSYDSKGTSDLPTYPNPILDESGNVVTTKLDKTEMIALSDKVQTIMEDEAREGEYSLFDRLVEEYGEDEGMVKYPNGYYMTRTSDYDSPEVIEALFDMDTGEIRRVESEYGIHIVMKYELDKGGYADKDNKDFFVTEDGTYSFVNLLKSDLLEEYLKQYKESIVIDEERLKALSMKSVGANYNY